MNKPKITFFIFTFLLVGLFGSTFSFAQTDAKTPRAEPSYEVILQVLVASNNAADSKAVPQALAGVVKRLKTTYLFSSYQLTSTYLQRAANTGNVDFKSLSGFPPQNQENYAPTFLEWKIGHFRSLPNEKGESLIQLQDLRFGQRIPIKLGNAVNYEHIGLLLHKLSLPENVPTVIGSLSGSRPDELMFLVLTFKPVE